MSNKATFRVKINRTYNTDSKLARYYVEVREVAPPENEMPSLGIRAGCTATLWGAQRKAHKLIRRAVEIRDTVNPVKEYEVEA